MITTLAQVQATEPQGRRHDISAEAPLGEMFSYIGGLRSLYFTQRRANFTTKFARYAPVPKRLREALHRRDGGAG